jgi:hypothetical protein
MHREKSLFAAGDSLLAPEMFPDPAHREFASKPLKVYKLFGGLSAESFGSLLYSLFAGKRPVRK